MCAGGIMGVSYQNWQIVRHRTPVQVGDFSQKISFLHFEKIENGILYGSLQGEEARIQIGEQQMESLFPGNFSFSVVDILPLLKKIPAPEGAHFVASKNGKYMYSLDSPEAAMITVQNRIFFSTLEEGYEKGFQQKK